MRILVTNDDGINSEGIKILAAWAQKLGHVTVCAPQVQQSANSHAINIHRPIEVVRATDFGTGVDAYAVGSTPVDSVRFATLGLQTTYDLVLSGVNRGFNMGEDILYSGTVGNVYEAALRGCKGIAFSTDPTSFDEAARQLDAVWQFFTDNDLLGKNAIYNVNIPLDSHGIKWTKQGGAYFTDQFVQAGATADGILYDQQGYSVYKYGTDYTLDTDSVMNGYISVTPLSTRRDDIDVWRKIKL